MKEYSSSICDNSCQKTYSYSEAFEASSNYFNGDEFAAKVFVDKYALQNNKGEYLELTPCDMHHRIAKELARIELKYPNPISEDEIFNLLDHYKYLVPQGSPMSAIGNLYQLQSLANCFVIPGIYSSKLDSYGGILLADQQLIQICKRRGGVGMDISGIRPKGAPAANAARTTDGISVFMERFSNSVREVGQSGRRGALLLTISINHPEIETFINIKRDKTKVTGANISIRLTDEFMHAVKEDENHILRFPVDVKPEDAKITKVVKAKDIWNQIIDSAWTSAEPGIMFWDTVQRTTPSDIYKEEGFESISMNPCGELVLPCVYSSCKLLSCNLTSYVDNPFTSSSYFNFDLFKRHAIIAQKLMDDIVDLEVEHISRIIEKIESDPESMEVKLTELNLWKKILETSKIDRRTGLGITGLGDTLAMLNIKYGSKESIDMTYRIYRTLAIGAHTSSCILAKERGAFPIFDYEKESKHEYLSGILNECGEEVVNIWRDYGRRNMALTTTAPTGSVSAQTQTSSGIEPVFSLHLTRRKKINPSDKNTVATFVDELGDRWQEFDIHHHGLDKWMEVTGKTDIDKSPYWKSTADSIDWVASVDIQAAAQKSIDHSISKTCNLPEDVSREVVSQVYMRAWESGCKGITVYREGSRSGVLINNEKKQRPNDIKFASAPKRPPELPCDIRKAKVQGEGWTIFVGLLNGQPYEIFGGLSKYVEIPNKYKSGRIIKNGKVDGISTYNVVIGEGDDQMTIKDIADVFENANFGAFSRTISLALRHGTPVQYVVEQLLKDKKSDMMSFSKVMARVLKNYIKDGTKPSDRVCPACKKEDSVVYQEGCPICNFCGFTKCG